MRVLPCKFTAPAPARLAISSDAASLSTVAEASVTAAALAIAEPPASVTEPATTLSVPVKVFAPESVSSPPPALVKPSEPLTTPPRTALLSRFSVPVPTTAISPFKVNEPEFSASPSVTSPDSATRLESTRAVAESLERRPELSVSSPDPSAELFAILTVPPLRANPPLKVLVPPRASVEVPPLTRAPEPLITPANTVDAVPLIVSVLPCKFTKPEPARLPMTSDAANRRAPPAPSVRLDAFAKALPPPKVSVPWFTTVTPAKVLLPLSVSSPAPSFTNEPGPLKLPLTSTALLMFNTEFAASEPVPAKLSEPFLTESPRVTVPPSTRPFNIAREAVESLMRRPPRSVKLPVPSAIPAPTSMVPTLRRTPPLKLLEPVNVNTPPADFASDPAPWIAPEYSVEAVPPKVSVPVTRLIVPAP